MISAFIAAGAAHPTDYEKYAVVSGYRTYLGLYLVCY